MRNEVSIDWIRTERVGIHLSQWVTKASLYQWMAPESLLSDDAYLRAVLYAASICHSTKGALSGYFDGSYFKGWDFLLRGMVLYFEDRHGCDDGLTTLTGPALEEILSRHAEPCRVSFMDRDRRAEIVRELAWELKLYKGDIRLLIGADGSRLRVDGRDGAYARLATLSAFGDRQAKKSTTFLMTSYFSRRITISDAQAVEPMIDYHRIRLLLRLGCLAVPADLATKLRSRLPVKSPVEHALRSCALTVSKQLTQISGQPALELDVLLWAFARSACRAEPVCVTRRFENASFSAFTGITPVAGCDLAAHCCSAGSDIAEMLWEPVCPKEDY